MAEQVALAAAIRNWKMTDVGGGSGSDPGSRLIDFVEKMRQKHPSKSTLLSKSAEDRSP